MPVFTNPISAAKRLEKLHRDFFWGGLGEELKYHLVDWDTICSAVLLRGFRVTRLAILNQSLLGKRLCRFTSERDSWWRKVACLGMGQGRVHSHRRKVVCRMGWGFGREL